MTSLAMEWATTRGGLVAWIVIVLLIVGVGLLMRHLSLAGRLPRFRQAALIVAVSTGLLVLAGLGGFALLRGATLGG